MNFRSWLESEYADDGQGNVFWSGSGGKASGILPICSTTHRICLAWRSPDVHMGNCFGTIGGAVEPGTTPVESAKNELHEETGFNGAIQLIPAYVFNSGTFRYYNFLGKVQAEFPLNPLPGFRSETTRLEWKNYQEILDDMQANPHNYHQGLLVLFRNNRNEIEKEVQYEGENVQNPMLPFKSNPTIPPIS